MHFVSDDQQKQETIFAERLRAVERQDASTRAARDYSNENGKEKIVATGT